MLQLFGLSKIEIGIRHLQKKRGRQNAIAEKDTTTIFFHAYGSEFLNKLITQITTK